MALGIEQRASCEVALELLCCVGVQRALRGRWKGRSQEQLQGRQDSHLPLCRAPVLCRPHLNSGLT